MHDSQVRRIIVQADGKSRLNGNDIEDLHVRNDQGKLLPLSSFVRLDWTAGPRSSRATTTTPPSPSTAPPRPARAAGTP